MDMDLGHLTVRQNSLLRAGKLQTASEIMLLSSQEIARKCSSSVNEAQEIAEAFYKMTTPTNLFRLDDTRNEGSEACTTGDSVLDDALGGGIRPSMIWEIAGESAAGKTQFAIQLSLFAQLPREQGGLSGSTCYLTTSSRLPTPRFVQLIRAHPLLSVSDCSLNDIHTLTTPTVPHLIHVLSQNLPSLISEIQYKPESKPPKLLVIDALAELFHGSNKTTTNTLVERAKSIVQISTLLQDIAQKHKIAVVVLNEVLDTFETDVPLNESQDVSYNEQSRWFGQAHSIASESKKEPSLGLVWANQVNARILLSRTGRRWHLDQAESLSAKRSKANDSSKTLAVATNKASANDPTLIRRLSIIFSCISRPVSCDYILTESGISAIQSDPSNKRGNGRPSDIPTCSGLTFLHNVPFLETDSRRVHTGL